MEIKASCKLDVEALKALTRFSMFKKGNPKKRMFWRTVLYVLLIGLLVFDMVLLGARFELTLMISLGVFMLLWGFYLYYFMPRIRYKGMGKLKGAVNTYIFTDDEVQIDTQGLEYTGETRTNYNLFARCFETSKYFFLYQTRNQVVIIDKSTLEGGTAEELRAKLAGCLGKKYVICRY